MKSVFSHSFFQIFCLLFIWFTTITTKTVQQQILDNNVCNVYSRHTPKKKSHFVYSFISLFCLFPLSLCALCYLWWQIIQIENKDTSLSFSIQSEVWIYFFVLFSNINSIQCPYEEKNISNICLVLYNNWFEYSMVASTISKLLHRIIQQTLFHTHTNKREKLGLLVNWYDFVVVSNLITRMITKEESSFNV